MTKILLVEDDKSLREIYGVRLLAEGYDIVSAGDGEEALAMAIKERPQLIVSDVMMPKISGFDMLDILRSTTETKAIKVIMMTALSSEDQRARGEALGADRYLVKSQVGIEDVVRTVHDVLADMPIRPQTAQQTFGTPVPSAVTRPTALVAPRPVVMPIIPTPQPLTNPVAPTQVSMPQPSPIPVPIPQPAIEPQPIPTPQPVQPIINTPPINTYTPPVQPIIQPSPFASVPVTTNPLPQPTAPFSSQRPASLGNRIIQPLSQPQIPEVDVATLMNQELNGTPVLQVVPLPTPPVPPVTSYDQPQV